MNARTTALSALIATRRQNAWSDGVLKEYIARDRLDARDAALASRLCYGVLQNRMLLDFYIAYFLNGKLRELQPVVLDILRLGAFQIVFLDKIPVSAAVNEAVEQCKSYANRRAAGLVNGLLRAMARSRDALPEPPDLATKYSHPQELVELLEESVGKDAIEPLLKCDNEITPAILHANPLRADAESVFAELEEAGAVLTPHPWLPDCRLAQGTGNLERLMPSGTDGSTFRIRRRIWRRWPPAWSRGCRCWMPVRPPAARASPRRCRCAMREASSPATFIRIS